MPKSVVVLCSPGQAALILRVSSKTVVRWAEQGLLRTESVTKGGHRRFDRAAVEKLAARREREAVPA